MPSADAVCSHTPLILPVDLRGCKPLASMLGRFDFGVAWYRIIADALPFCV